MTCRTPKLLDLDQQRVAVAVEEYAVQDLDVAAFFALSPELFAAAAVVTHATGFERFFPGLAVHPGHHQDVPGRGILSDGGYEFVPVKIGAVDLGHGFGEDRRVLNSAKHEATRAG